MGGFNDERRGGFLLYLKIAGGVLGGLALIVFLVSLVMRKGDIENAIDRYDGGDYRGALVLLNKLQKTADYDGGEKICYYKARAINALAAQLERKYADELGEIGTENENAHAREKETRYLEKKLASINEEIEGDLQLMADKKAGRIVSRGRFYDEFIARYKGSRFIEDLDFEELQKIERTEHDKLLAAVANFYAKYPNTYYLSHIVKMIFRALNDGNVSVKGREDLVKGLVLEFARRYPTSAEIQKIYTCAGNDVNLRNSPATSGGVVGKVKKDELLIQIEKSMDTAQVGDVRDHWYRVSSLAGLRGWIFGKFLAPVDVAQIEPAARKETWAIEDYFKDWEDSNTPKNWMHVPGGEKGALSFAVKGDSKIMKIDCPADKLAGLYRRFDSGGAFTLRARARLKAGESVVVFAYALRNGKAYYLRLRDGELDLSGRRVPVKSSDWNEFTLESEDGRHAKLLVNGDVVLNRIPPAETKLFPERGVYCLFAAGESDAVAEMEYIKVRN
ncbi:MAG: SH3 domain-containing protein [Spirochaetes bacterium]|nr:MAG: SH3 domain-containing protein [Spirochaetota bacterium]